MGLGAQPKPDSRSILHNVKYPHLRLKTVYPALKLAGNCYLHYNVKMFFFKTANLIVNNRILPP